MKKKFTFLTLLGLIFLSALMIPEGASAHGGEKHPKKAKVAQVDSLKKTTAVAQDTIVFSEVAPTDHAEHKANPAKVHASIADFPHIHPLMSISRSCF
ncbi:hypothetical protein [Rufibacter sp. LB8]|uniref:hypothetical protein n=1 Tax=Rufibacter sp. LB8 TaxID=2777781 RepID=UPI00178C228D|nr:hypothetical protein [Rufibacter sp. LB8]